MIRERGCIRARGCRSCLGENLQIFLAIALDGVLYYVGYIWPLYTVWSILLVTVSSVVNIGQCGQYWSLCPVWSILVSMDNTGHRVKCGRYYWSLCPVWSILLVTVDSAVSTAKCGQYWSLCSVWSTLVTVSPVWSILVSDPSVCPCLWYET